MAVPLFAAALGKAAPAIISGAASLIGGAFTGRMARNERKHVEQRMLDMDNTKHQREVRDLRRAGLNPILSATQGAASAGQVPGPAPVPDYGSLLGEATGRGIQMLLAKEQIENIRADTRQKEATAENTDANTRRTNWQYALERQYGDTEKKAAIHTALLNIRSLTSTSQSSAVDLKQKSSRVARELADPQLQEFLLSEGYATQKQIDRIVSGDADWSDVVRIFKFILR